MHVEGFINVVYMNTKQLTDSMNGFLLLQLSHVFYNILEHMIILCEFTFQEIIRVKLVCCHGNYTTKPTKQSSCDFLHTFLNYCPNQCYHVNFGHKAIN